MKQNTFNPISGPAKETFEWTKGYVKYDLGRILQSEQGQLVNAWANGWLSSRVAFDSSSNITAGLSQSAAAAEYRLYLRGQLRLGLPLDRYHYDAENFTLKNPKFVNDARTFTAWEQASNSSRSLLTVGSHDYYATVIEQTGSNSAVVQITAWNEMTLGSLLGPIRSVANTIPGSTGPFSPVVTTFTWTEEVEW